MSVDNSLPRGLVFDLARVTIELEGPMAIGSGASGDLEDRPCVVDSNGLPAIPGSSIAGVLRAHVSACLGEAAERQAFGFQHKATGASSRVEVSWAQLHDSRDRPVTFRQSAEIDDPLLVELRSPVVRDHVRIDGFGAAADRGKYDVSLVPRGARFTFEIVLHPGAGLSLDELLAPLHRRELRFGGGTRNGQGAVKLVSARTRRFDLTTPDGRSAFVSLPRALDREEPSGVLQRWEPSEESAPGVPGRLDVELELTPEDFLLIGRGEARLVDDDGKGADLAPVRERRVQWRGTAGSMSDEAACFVPGTALKGALRHRVAFHAFRLRKEFSDTLSSVGDEPTPPEVGLLFGEIKGSGSDAVGRPGCVFVEDCWPDAAPTLQRIDHVSIDRFSGAPLSGHLFQEEVLWFEAGSPPLRFRLRVDPITAAPGGEQGEVARARRALALAVRDLCTGRLALGAAANRGHGYLSGPFPAALEAWL